MRCAWDAYLKILPQWMRADVDKFGREDLQELRLRNGQPPKLISMSRCHCLERCVTAEDIHYIVNIASQYSPWAATTISRGYLTATGGHRIGICGDAVLSDNTIMGIRTVTSLCLRVARDFTGIADGTQKFKGSVLIIGPPGSGKTTLLRDLIRHRSNAGVGSVAVLDERGEIFPSVNGISCFPTGDNTDILTGCNKRQGIDMLLRTMSPVSIAVDEITEESDAKALLNAGWSGVTLIATAHASSKTDLYTRPIYQSLIANHLFDTLLVLRSDKTWHTERI